MWKGLALAVVVAAAAGVAAGWGRMSQTWDEPAHLAAGLEWLQDGTGYLWTENPPLARVAGALGPFLSGARLPLSARDARGVEADGWVAYQLGNQALWETGRYEE